MKWRIYLLFFLGLLCLATGLMAGGNLGHTQFTSAILGNKRDVWVYTPEGYPANGKSYPLLIAFDGQAYVSDLIPVPCILDKLIAEGKIPPILAVFVSSIDQPSRKLELPCYQPFTEFLVRELMPWIHSHYKVTNNPHRIIVTGSSYGGLASVYAAATYPNCFGNVLSQSGSFGWSPTGNHEEQWLINYLEQAPFKKVTFYLDVGSLETSRSDKIMPTLYSNRRMRDLLLKKGNKVIYTEFAGGHEYACWKLAFPEGLASIIDSWQ